jgi:hypothetical protein
MPLGVLDLETAVARARSSEEGEAYLNLHTTENGRLGVCVTNSERQAGFVIELLVSVLKGDGPVDLDKCYLGLGIAREAQQNGFELTSQGDGWIYCHKSVRRDEVEVQCALMSQMIE